MSSRSAIGLIGKDRLLRDTFRALLEASGTFTIAFDRTADEQPLLPTDGSGADAALLLLVGAGDHHLTMFRCLSEIADHTRVLVLTEQSDQTSRAEAIALGAHGVISFDASGDLLLKALGRVCAGELWLNRSDTASVIAGTARRRSLDDDPEMMKIASLTWREREIIGLVTEGLTNRDLAARLFISESTARNHMTSILDKLDVTDRFQLTVYAFRHGLVLCPQTPAKLRVAALMTPLRGLRRVAP
jgi:DNA-binding NarL/FixJ family response regulator